ncbi:SDR family oxidoreductase [Maricaulis sp. CAU 1757]
MRVAVLGGYGLIGSACVRALRKAGCEVVGFGRNAASARRSAPDIEWVIQDIGGLDADEWRELLSGVEVVVNAAGALQDGPRDDLNRIHDTMIGELVAALRGTPTRFVQISAAGVRADAPTAFFRSKARGDQRLTDNAIDTVILRPTLVLGPDAYGGTALLRASAAVPLVQFRLLADRPVQTVCLDDVAQAVVDAVRGRIRPGTIADLTEAEAHSFAALQVRIRQWLGFPGWRFGVDVPDVLVSLSSRLADGAGRLGWRSPYRRTALRTLEDGVTGDPSAWAAAGGTPCRSLDQTLAAMPATVQERWFARLTLLMPVLLGILSVFWCATGIIALFEREAATRLLVDHGVSGGIASGIVIAGALADLALGLAILVRRWSRPACLGMAALSIAYLVGGSLLALDLWLDPLGPLLKILPVLGLCLVVAVLVEER